MAIEARAKARWEAARAAVEHQDYADCWVQLLAMGCDLAAFEATSIGAPHKFIDLERVARDGGLIP